MGVRGPAPYPDCVLVDTLTLSGFAGPDLIDRCAVPSVRPLERSRGYGEHSQAAARWQQGCLAGRLQGFEGKRRHKQFSRRRDADEWLVSARGEIAEGTHVAARDTISFKEAGEAWINNCVRRRLEETTINSYRQHLDDHLYPLWQDKKLNALTKVNAQTLYEDLLEGDRTPDMVRRVRIDAGAVLNYAKSKGWSWPCLDCANLRHLRTPLRSQRG